MRAALQSAWLIYMIWRFVRVNLYMLDLCMTYAYARVMHFRSH